MDAQESNVNYAVSILSCEAKSKQFSLVGQKQLLQGPIINNLVDSEEIHAVCGHNSTLPHSHLIVLLSMGNTCG